MIAIKKMGLVTIIGYNTLDNGKFVLKDKGDKTFVKYQFDSFNQRTVGYVEWVGYWLYKTVIPLDFLNVDKDINYFFTREEGIEYLKQYFTKLLKETDFNIKE